MTLEPFEVLLFGALLAGFVVCCFLLAMAFGVGLWFWRILGRFAEIKLVRVANTVKLESTLGRAHRYTKPTPPPLRKDQLS